MSEKATSEFLSTVNEHCNFSDEQQNILLGDIVDDLVQDLCGNC